jgi:hypothetical protein
MDNLDRAEQIYAAERLLAEAQPTPGAIGIGEIVRFLNSSAATLDHAQTRYLFARPHLREAYAALRRRAMLIDVPRVAAASDGGIQERRFEGGRLRITRTADDPQVYVLVFFEKAMAPQPTSLLLEPGLGGLIKIEIPSPDAEGEALVILDVENERDAEAVSALLDPNTTGAFMLP